MILFHLSIGDGVKNVVARAADAADPVLDIRRPIRHIAQGIPMKVVMM